MPVLPSRPSTTIARRCAASCTDRTLHRFCQASRPQPQQIEGSDSGSLPRCGALCSQLSPGGCLLRRVSLVPERPGDGPFRRERTSPARACTRQASWHTPAEPPELHVRRPNLSLDDLLRFVITLLHVTRGGHIGCLRCFQGGSCTLYRLLP